MIYSLQKMKDLLWVSKRFLTNTKRSYRPSSAPYISGDDFRNLCNFIFDEEGLSFLPSDVFEDALVFVKAYPSLIDYFFRQIHPRIPGHYRLLTHNQDCTIPGVYEKFLFDSKLKQWYSTNILSTNTKVTSIPIGVLNRRASGDTVEFLQQFTATPPLKRELVYMNFHIGGETERAGYRQERQNIYNIFSGAAWVTASEKVLKGAYLQHIARHKYVISPPGHGTDCFRHWEAMYLGTIPIVLKGVNMGHYHDYPILFVGDYKDVTPELLNQRYEGIKSRTFDRRRLFMTYWKDILKG